MRAPDDTLSPPDGNTDEDTLLQLNFPVPAEANWQTVTYALSQGAVGGEVEKLAAARLARLKLEIELDRLKKSSQVKQQ